MSLLARFKTSADVVQRSFRKLFESRLESLINLFHFPAELVLSSSDKRCSDNKMFH